MGKNYEGTHVAIPQTYQNTDTAVVLVTVNTDSLNFASIRDVSWWKMFNDPTLDSLILLAIKQNRTALIAAENIMQARFALNIQNAEFLPKFNISASAQRGNYLNNQVGTESNMFLGATSVYWEIDIWGKYRRLSEAARADLMASEYGYRAIMISLISDVATGYFSILQAQSQLEISKRNAASRDSMLQIIQSRYDKGIVPMLDVNQAQIQKNIAEGAVPQYYRRLVQLQNALSVLIGQNPAPFVIHKSLEEQQLQIAIPDILPVQLLAQRPDVLAAEYQLIGRNARVGAAQANRLPNLSVTALLGVAGTDFSNISLSNPLWNIGGQLMGPLFYWNQRKRMVDIAKSERFQALFAYENTVFNALREVEDVLVEISTVQQEIQIATSRRAAALSAQDLSRERYSKGVTSYLEFLEQQRQAFDAELLLEEKRAQLLSAQVRLYKALGGGWISEAEKL